MREQMKKITGVCLCLAMALGMTSIAPTTTKAATSAPKFSIKKKNTVVKYSDSKLNTYYFTVAKKYIPEKATDVSVKSSKTKVATVENDTKNTAVKNSCFITLTAKKAGTTTITVKAKLGTKSYKEKFKVTVAKYSNPAKTLTLASKGLKSKFRTDIAYDYKVSTTSIKVKATANKNWKFKKIRYSYTDAASKKTVKKYFKNKKTIKRVANATNESIKVTFQSKKYTNMIDASTTKASQKGLEILTINLTK